jgi:hypothetical protein
MQVLGDLIILPKATGSLPLPWWHRAPLGFIHDTKVYVGLVTSARPVGDIVVAALDINKWQNIIRVDCKHKEELGVIAKLLEAVQPLNIALAETVTMETGRHHRATLFCEALGDQKVTGFIPNIKHMLDSNGFEETRITPYVSRDRIDPWGSDKTKIDRGWLHNIPFLDWIKASSPKEEDRAKIDLTRAVVSADTETRVLRYVFPFKGARTVKVRHMDKPGALLCSFQAIQDRGLNVLSALLRRGGQGEDRAELVAVCEHKGSEAEAEAAFGGLPDAILKLDQQYNFDPEISEGIRAASVIDFLPWSQRTARGERPMLLAEVAGSTGSVVGEVRKVLHDYAYKPLEPTPEGGCWQMAALLERSQAGVLITPSPLSTGAVVQLAQRVGFLQACGKPLLVLSEAEQPDGVSAEARPSLFTWKRIRPADPTSIDQAVSEWLSAV